MRVLHVLAPAECGGLESVVAGLAAAQREAGCDPHVALVASAGDSVGALPRRLIASGIPVHVTATSPRGYVNEYRSMRALCGRLAPTVVHTHGFRPDVVDAAAARAAGIAVVSTVHGFTGGGLRVRLYEHVQCLALRRCDAVAAVAESVRNRLEAEGLSRRRLHVVPNAYEPAATLSRDEARALLGADGSAFLVGWIGRLSHEKGADVLLDALAALPPRMPWRAAFIGDGGLRPRLARRAAELGLGDRVRWCGIVPDARRVLTAFDALVLSSRTEGSPMVLLEAMAAGVPVVATRVGGVTAMLGDEDAILVPPERPLELAGAIETILGEPSSARRRAQLAAGRLRRQFGVSEWARQYERIYASVAKGSVRS